MLTGVIAALLGQRIPGFEAAQMGVFVHGLAGDIARDHDGEIGMIAGDIVDALPGCVRARDGGRGVRLSLREAIRAKQSASSGLCPERMLA